MLRGMQRAPLLDGRRSEPVLFVLALCALFAACSGISTTEDMPGPDVFVAEPALREGCNPLGGGPDEDCFLPFPSDFYTRPDNTSPTGLRVELPAGVLPVPLKGPPIDPGQLGRRDGFSPATPILAYFPRARSAAGVASVSIDPKSLPEAGHIEETLGPNSTVQLLRYDTGERVPLLAEVDRNAGPGERQAIVIYPQLRLRPKTRYVVALRGVMSRGGTTNPSGTVSREPMAPPAGFRVLRDDKLHRGSVRFKLRARYAEIFALLEKQGVPRAELQLAWDFTTASDEPITGRLVRMRDQAFTYRSMMPPAPISVNKSLERPRMELLRQIFGTFSAPSFLTSDSDGRLRIGADGEPELRGYGQFPLIIHVPACAENSMLPLPVMIYGHGLFGDAIGEMDSAYQREIINRLCVVQIGTDWIGLSSADRATAASVLSDFNGFAQLTDRLQQAQINFAVLARMVRSGVLERLPELQQMGRLLVDSKRVFYYGISNGAIQGMAQLALSPDVSRAALNVGGGFWSQMMFRSSNFGELGALLAANYPDPLDRQLLVALTQWHWDYTDPATYAPHVLRELLPGSGGPKRLLYQEGVGDAQVPNLMTRAIVRSMGLPLLNQPVEAVFGIGQVDGPAPSAYVQFDVGESPRPGAENTPPKSNRVHEAIRRLEAAKAQLLTFLVEDRGVIDTCGGKPCTFQ